MRYRLSTRNAFISPMLLNEMSQGRAQLLPVASDGTITVPLGTGSPGAGLVLYFTHAPTAGPGPVEPGTVMRVWLTDFFYCQEPAEYEREQSQRRLEQQQAEAERQEIDRQQRNRQREQAEQINGSLALPVAWKPAIKDVLSGLSAASWGDGRNRATVQHIWLSEPLQVGRITRKQGDFLCTSSGGTNGQNYTGQKEETWTDGEGNTYPAPVTCKACLRIARRMSAR